MRRLTRQVLKRYRRGFQFAALSKRGALLGGFLTYVGSGFSGPLSKHESLTARFKQNRFNFRQRISGRGLASNKLGPGELAFRPALKWVIFLIPRKDASLGITHGGMACLTFLIATHSQ